MHKAYRDTQVATLTLLAALAQKLLNGVRKIRI